MKKNSIQGYVVDGELDAHLNPLDFWQQPLWVQDRDNYIYQLQQEGHSYEQAMKIWVDTVTKNKEIQ